MPKTFYRDVTREISALGWERSTGGRGSHQKWRKEGVNRTLVVPFDLYSRMLANAILRYAGSS